MTHLALVRHGETYWNALRRLQGSSDIPLNATGRAQAARAGSLLAAGQWDVLVSSPLSRAGETADIIGTHLNLTRSGTHPGLTERHFGEAEGITDYEAWDRWPDGNYPGIEPRADVTRRGLAALDDLAERHPGSAIVAVSHGGLIRSVIGALHGWPVPRIPNAAITALRHDGARWAVVTVNGREVDPALPANRAPVSGTRSPAGRGIP
ncbi:histidine phosphatase family protein [Rhodococcus sp. NPDC058505]|uniref:histidine phosphatase family protein n=1 Tax=Rhodococcus sp. NPDC058505 TaxID=3346531 RepID=UPI0036655C58